MQRSERSFEKNGCPTLNLSESIDTSIGHINNCCQESIAVFCVCWFPKICKLIKSLFGRHVIKNWLSFFKIVMHCYFLFRCQNSTLCKNRTHLSIIYNYENISRVRNSLFHSSLFRSKSLPLKSDRERNALVALYKRATRAIGSQALFNKEQFAQQMCCFHQAFDSFSLIFPFLYPRANLSLFKRATGDIRSWSLLRRATVSDLLLKKSESLFRSFAHKKRVFRRKNQRVNSQPWIYLTVKLKKDPKLLGVLAWCSVKNVK